MSRLLRVLLPVAVIAALVVAVLLVRSDVRSARSEPFVDTPVAAGEAGTLVLNRETGAKALSGEFTLESLRSYPRLTPVSEYDDPLERDGGTVVVAVFSCVCPVDDDLGSPKAFVVHPDGRRWEAESIFDEYAELAGLDDSSDLGEKPRVRYAEAFVVPEKAADEVVVHLALAFTKGLEFRR